MLLGASSIVPCRGRYFGLSWESKWSCDSPARPAASASASCPRRRRGVQSCRRPPTAPLEDVFEYERRNLLRDLAARLNNKGRYALGRLHEEMYAGTPLAGPDVGTVEAIQEASLSDAVAEGMRTVSEGEVDIYLLAPCTPLQAERLVRRHLKLQPRRRERFSSVPQRPPRCQPQMSNLLRKQINRQQFRWQENLGVS